MHFYAQLLRLEYCNCALSAQCAQLAAIVAIAVALLTARLASNWSTRTE